MDKKRRQSTVISFSAFVPVLFFLGLFYLPLLSFFSALNLVQSETLLFEDTFSTLKISFLQALGSTLLSGLLGTGLAFLYLDSGFPGVGIIRRLSLICFSLPVLVVCLAVIAFWGKSGWVGRYLAPYGFEFYGWFGVLIAHSFMNFAIFFRSVVERLSQDGRLHEKAALNLGASRLQTFWSITWPKMLPTLWSSGLLVFVYCFTSFLVVLLLGGGPRFTTLETLIYQSLRLDQDFARATLLAALQAVFCLSLFFLGGRFSPQTFKGTRSDFKVFTPRTLAMRAVSFLLLLLGSVFLLGPLFTLVVDGLKAISVAFTWDVGSVALRGFGLALVVSFSSLFVGFPAAYLVVRSEKPILKAFMKVSTSLPLVFSTVLLAMAVFTAYGESELFQQTLLGPYLIQVLVAMPVVVRYLVLGFERIPKDMLFAATSLGATPLQRLLWVEWPLLKGAARLSFLLAVCLSLGEVSSLLMFAVGGEGTLPLWIFRQMGRYHFEEAAAGSLVLVVLLIFLFQLFEKEERLT